MGISPAETPQGMAEALGPASTWGKCHKELRVDTQIVHFRQRPDIWALSLNQIFSDEKELKMLTKGQV